MRIDRLAIASGAVGMVLVLFMLAYLANGWTQIRSTGLYVLPDSLVDIIKYVLAASVAVLTWGGLNQARNSIEGKQADGGQIEDKKIGS